MPGQANSSRRLWVMVWVSSAWASGADSQAARSRAPTMTSRESTIVFSMRISCSINCVELSKLNAQRGHASGVSAITTAAPTKQNRPRQVGVHCAASSSIVVWAGDGVECMGVSCGQRKSPRAVAAGLNKEPVTFRGAPGEEGEREGEEKPRPGDTDRLHSSLPDEGQAINAHFG
ncbi:hypothetical protein GL58_20480 [Comamonas testosteroni]|uniref:Secreted protein n=1 Tax=Comamonas testosteroni TaxID=285 RepID=A0A0L7MB12_COMTE|nr:hypothetical protein GL58_20480 [Comamonas testosteroni]